ncbi:MAG: glycosyltransferase [Patescibacteria group bacterium]
MQNERNKVTVVIPLYNPEMEFLIGTLQIIIKNEDNLIDKIILVDDGSEIPIKNYSNELKRISHKIEIIRQENKGPGGARNTGVALADTEIVVFLDHDCQPHKDWIKNLIRPIIYDNVVAVGGTVLTYEEDGIISQFADFRELLRRPVKNKEEKITNVITANSAFLRKTFNAAGGFDERLQKAAEDLDFTYKLSKLGYQDRLHYASKAIVTHKHRSTFKDFWKQQFNYGLGSVCHCLYRKRDPGEIGFVFPKPLNVLKYIFQYFYFSITLIPTIDRKYGKLNKYIIFPALEYIRRMAILTGGIKSYYTKCS